MKKLYILIYILFLSLTLKAADELSWVDEQIEAIKPPRKGLQRHDVNSIRSPFVFLSVNKDKKNVKRKKIVRRRSVSKSVATKSTLSQKSSLRLTLNAVINKSALINKRWYRLNENVYGYTLSKITPTTVLLIKGNKKLLLSTNDIKRNLKFR